MSDGNFNRSLLPHTPFHSGLQTGKSMARMKALEAFKGYLAEVHPEYSDEDRQEHLAHYSKHPKYAGFWGSKTLANFAGKKVLLCLI